MFGTDRAVGKELLVHFTRRAEQLLVDQGSAAETQSANLVSLDCDQRGDNLISSLKETARHRANGDAGFGQLYPVVRGLLVQANVEVFLKFLSLCGQIRCGQARQSPAHAFERCETFTGAILLPELGT